MENEQVEADSGAPVTDSGTTADALTPSAAEHQTPPSGPESTPAEESFFDRSSLTPELEPAYKEMQGAFTKRMQELAEHRRADQAALDAYSEFQRDPQGTVQRLAQQYGVIPNADAGLPKAEWNPETWQEVFDKVSQDTEGKLLQKLQPLLGKVKELQKSHIETYLDSKHPDWRVYEDSMIKLIQKHPTLAEDPDTLYDMAVPSEVKQRRATQEAMKRLEASAQGASVSGPSTTSKKPADTPKVTDFNSAVVAAKERLAAGP